MPVIRRKLASAPPRKQATVIPIRKQQPQQLRPITPSQWQPDSNQRLLNVKATAKYLGTSVWQVRKSIREGDFPSFKYGNKDMVDRADLDAFVERRKAAA